MAATGCAAGADDDAGGDGEGAGSGVASAGYGARTTDTGANGAGGEGVGGAGTGGTGSGASGAAATGSGRFCSSDLRQVVDSVGDVVESCAEDQGCFEGFCIGACEAADAHGTSLGCEFVVASTPFTGAGWPGTDTVGMRGPCHAAFVANGWHRAAKLTLQYGDQLIDVSAHARIPTGNVPYPSYEPLPAEGLPPGEVAIVFLSHDPQANNAGIGLTCPVAPAITHDTAVTGTGRGTAFRLHSDTPITAYDILPYGGAHSFLPSASLLLPEASLGTSYVVVAPHDSASDPIYGGKLWVTLVGTEDGTSVHVRPRTSLLAGPGLGPAPAGTTSTFSLRAGETIQWLGTDPTGAEVTSDKPIAAFSGSTYLWVTGGESVDGGRDASHQQIPPVETLGYRYVGAGVVTRRADLQREVSIYRLVGMADGTVLTWSPSPPAGAPTSLGIGEVAELATSEPFLVSAQDADHPFSLSQYMTGSMFAAYMRQDGTSPKPIGVSAQCGLGDEDWTMLLSPDQFLSRYVFFADPKYATTNLVITRRNDGSGFHDVLIDCLGTVTGWQPVGPGGEFEVAHVDLVRGGTPVGQCETSRHHASSAGPFGIAVWGTDWCSSYGYPAGGGFRAINGLK